MNLYLITKKARVIMTSNITSSGEWLRWRWWWDRALQILTTILLSLFLPLSFLLLARLSAAQSNLSYPNFHGGSDDFLAFLFLLFNSTVLYLLLSLLAVSAFVHGLTGGRVTLIQLLLSHGCQRQNDQGSSRPRLSIAWLLLCTSLIFAELGIEFQSPSSSSSSDYRQNSPRGLLFFAVGLYETMIYWSESVVKAVVDDVVVMRFSSEEGEIKERRRWVVERVGLGLSFGALWWWRLRDHVDSLAAAEDDDHHVVLKVADFVSLGMYYLTLFTGVIRAFTVVTGIMQLIIRRRSKIMPPPAAAPSEENV